MREIEFRGKRIDNGEWVYGNYAYAKLAQSKDEKLTDAHAIVPFIFYEDDTPIEEAIVLPETVGQYTGLKDKNGVKIFEGDIISVFDKQTKRQGIYEIIWECEDLCWNNGFSVNNISGYSCITHICESDASNAEVIGTIHDNPELLKEANNEPR
jgi:uncharacterized phage protein (TIGR01671 family)